MSGVAFARLLADIFPPCLALAVLGAFAWRRLPRGGARTAIQIGASLLLFVPPLLSLFFANYSVAVLLYQRLTLAFFGYGMTGLLAYRLSTGHSPGASAAALGFTGAGRRTAKLAGRPANPLRAMLALLLVALPLSGLASWYLVGDYLLANRVIEGRTGPVYYHARRRSPGWYEIFIGGKGYAITRDLLDTFRPGEYVHAEVGVGSNTILRIRPL